MRPYIALVCGFALGFASSKTTNSCNIWAHNALLCIQYPILSGDYVLLVYAAAVLRFWSSTYGHGTGPILLDNVHCAGTETSLQQCAANPIGDHNCDHSDDAGVRCVCLHV